MSNREAPLIAPPLTDLPIETARTGFYRGFAMPVAIPAKAIITAFIVCAIAFPVAASEALAEANKSIIAHFAGWYIYVAAIFLVVCVVLAAVPRFGRMTIGEPGERAEFSRVSWFSMLFGAGLGVGMLTYSIGEPMAHFASNPEIIAGSVEARSAQAVESAYRYSFLHWGLTGWAIYATIGLAIGYISYRRGLPLTIRSGLTPLFGARMSGSLGHIVDIFAVVATVLGISVTLSLGVNQAIAGLKAVFGIEWLMKSDGSASDIGIVAMLALTVGLSTMSALSGVGKGVKWLSNLNLALTVVLMVSFLIAGSASFGLKVFGNGIVDYIRNLPELSVTLLSSDGTPTGDAMAQWQLDWTIYYWAWWIAYAPFVGMFIARISRGRTVREYVLGVVLAPSLMCFAWFAIIGGTAIDLELRGVASGAIIGTPLSQQLYVALEFLLPSSMTVVYAVIVLMLLLTYMVTSADSAILIINTINAAGEDEGDAHRRHHIIFWGVVLALIVGSLLVVGGSEAVSTAMILGALPFSVVAVLMVISIAKAIYLDTVRQKFGVPTTVQTMES